MGLAEVLLCLAPISTPVEGVGVVILPSSVEVATPVKAMIVVVLTYLAIHPINHLNRFRFVLTQY